MEYFFSPLACSFAGHLLIREYDLPVRTVPVSLRRKVTAAGLDFHAVSPQGLVPVLRMDDGRVLTENNAILQVLADLAPAAGLLPPRDTPEGQATLEWLGFVSTEVHKLCLYPIFQREAPEAMKAWCRALLPRKLAVAGARLAHRRWLAADHFTIADALFGWALMISQHLDIQLADEPPLLAYWQRLMDRASFAECLADERSLFREHA